MAAIVSEVRRRRRARRLGELEWFEVAYRAYLVALIGGGAVLWASSLVEDLAVTPAQLADVQRLGPSVLGVLAAAAIALGLRSGSDGGPIAVEAGDVQHLLLAPIPRRSVLTQPVIQRLRTTAFGGAVLGGAAGLLAADRLPGSRPAWVASGAAAGAAGGVAFVAVAVVTHAGRLPRPAATGLAMGVVVAQLAAAAGWLPAGPADSIGSLALWGLRVRAGDLAGVAAVLAAAVVAVLVAGRLRVEPLVRRAGLVAQLRFAVTMQDLRTVMLLRRQLRGEHARTRPWFGAASRPPTPGGNGVSTAGLAVVWTRGWRGLRRSPAARLARMGGLAVVAGLAAVAVTAGTTPAIIVVAGALHLLGLEAVEPLSQEIDHPDHADVTPHPRGWLLARHLLAPAAAVVPFGLLGAAVVAAVQPAHMAAAFSLALPVTWGGVAGAVVGVVRDAPDPLAAPAATAVPPEFAGFTTTMRLLWPIAVSVAGVVAVAVVAAAPSAAAVARSAVATLLLVAVVGWWVRRRDEWRQRWRRFLDEGRAAARASRVAS